LRVDMVFIVFHLCELSKRGNPQYQDMFAMTDIRDITC
jgi:hypothetical protein